MNGKPLDKWTKAELIEEVKRLRSLTRRYIETVMDLQGIKGSVSSEVIDAALSQHSKKN